jgi:peptidoglycan-N-acetylglucosamine deacetylase
MSTFLLIVCVVAAIVGLGVLFVFACSVPSLRLVGPVITHGPLGSSYIALTFDDGPAAPFTGQILDLLREHGIRATFFMCGKNVEKYPELARRIAQEGHQVGNHTFSHPFLYLKSSRFIADEIRRTAEAIEKASGARPSVFRPPYGARWPTLYPVLRRFGLTLVNWSVPGFDWMYGTEKIVAAVTGRLRGGSVILLHDGLETRSSRPIDQSRTVRALPAIIEAARTKGLEFVTLSEMLSERPARMDVRPLSSDA